MITLVYFAEIFFTLEEHEVQETCYYRFLWISWFVSFVNFLVLTIFGYRGVIGSKLGSGENIVTQIPPHAGI